MTPGASTKFCNTCQTGRPTFSIAPAPAVTPRLAASWLIKPAVAGCVALVVNSGVPATAAVERRGAYRKRRRPATLWRA
jgi:hypothetical protein